MDFFDNLRQEVLAWTERCRNLFNLLDPANTGKYQISLLQSLSPPTAQEILYFFLKWPYKAYCQVNIFVFVY